MCVEVGRLIEVGFEAEIVEAEDRMVFFKEIFHMNLSGFIFDDRFNCDLCLHPLLS